MFHTELRNRMGWNIGVNNNLMHLSIKVKESNGNEEMIWILTNNSCIKIILIICSLTNTDDFIAQ